MKIWCDLKEDFAPIAPMIVDLCGTGPNIVSWSPSVDPSSLDVQLKKIV